MRPPEEEMRTGIECWKKLPKRSCSTHAVTTLQGGLRFRRTLGGDGRDQEFADSPLGEGGFELTVPLATDPCGAANPDRSFSSIWTLMSLPRESGAP